MRNQDRNIELGKGRQVILSSAKLKAEKFNTKQEDDLYAWSNLRSEYAAEASYATARNISVYNYGYGGWGAGWMWNPWYSSWAFMPWGVRLRSIWLGVRLSRLPRLLPDVLCAWAPRFCSSELGTCS